MLRRRVQGLIGFSIRFLGIYSRLLNFVWRNKTTIIVYHDPAPEVFGKHIAFLSKYHQFISLSALIEAIYKKNESRLPANPLVITIDDGHKGNYRLLETIKAFEVHPTIYLCSHIVNTNRHFWWKSGYPDFYQLKKFPIQQTLDILRREIDFELEKEYPDRQALNHSEMMDMLPHVEFGSHTKFHPILTNCTAENCEEEIADSKVHLENLLGAAVEHFCFPNGDYGERELNIVKKNGYKSARTLFWGRNDLNADPYGLRVVEVLDHSSVNLLCAQLCGFWGAFRRLRFALRRIL